MVQQKVRNETGHKTSFKVLRGRLFLVYYIVFKMKKKERGF